MGQPTNLMADNDVQHLTQRLALLDQLRLPGNLTRNEHQPSVDKITEYLEQLLRQDPGVFLERYGQHLSAAELGMFTPIRREYEVDFYLKVLEDKLAAPVGTLNAAVKNRRLAKMNRLEAEGDFFSEDQMLNRAPLLHHHYVGQYQSTFLPEQAPSSRTGAGLAEMLLRQADNAETAMRLLRERQAEQLVERDQEEEEEEDDGTDTAQEQHEEAEAPSNEGGLGLGTRVSSAQQHAADSAAQAHSTVEDGTEEAEAAAGPAQTGEEGTSNMAEKRQQLDDFTELMKQRFLSGQEGEFVDYRQIDADASLDEDWAAVVNRDAEDRYFAD